MDAQGGPRGGWWAVGLELIGRVGCCGKGWRWIGSDGPGGAGRWLAGRCVTEDEVRALHEEAGSPLALAERTAQIAGCVG
jgi:hypothetical protein